MANGRVLRPPRRRCRPGDVTCGNDAHAVALPDGRGLRHARRRSAPKAWCLLTSVTVSGGSDKGRAAPTDRTGRSRRCRAVPWDGAGNAIRAASRGTPWSNHGGGGPEHDAVHGVRRLRPGGPPWRCRYGSWAAAVRRELGSIRLGRVLTPHRTVRGPRTNRYRARNVPVCRRAFSAVSVRSCGGADSSALAAAAGEGRAQEASRSTPASWGIARRKSGTLRSSSSRCSYDSTRCAQSAARLVSGLSRSVLDATMIES